MITCGNCGKGFHTFCVGEKRIPYARFPPEQRDLRDAFVAANFGPQWQCPKCQTQAAQTSPSRPTDAAYMPPYRDFGSSSSCKVPLGDGGGGDSALALEEEISPVQGGVAPSSAPLPFFMRTEVSFEVEPSAAPTRGLSLSSSRLSSSSFATDEGAPRVPPSSRSPATTDEGAAANKDPREEEEESDKQEENGEGKEEGGRERYKTSTAAAATAAVEVDVDVVVVVEEEDGRGGGKEKEEEQPVDADFSDGDTAAVVVVAGSLQDEGKDARDDNVVAKVGGEDLGVANDAEESCLKEYEQESCLEEYEHEGEARGGREEGEKGERRREESTTAEDVEGEEREDGVIRSAVSLSEDGPPELTVDRTGVSESGLKSAEQLDGEAAAAGREGDVKSDEDGQEQESQSQEEVVGVVEEQEGDEGSETVVAVLPKPDCSVARIEELGELAFRLGLTAVATVDTSMSEGSIDVPASAAAGPKGEAAAADIVEGGVDVDEEEAIDCLGEVPPGPEALVEEEEIAAERVERDNSQDSIIASPTEVFGSEEVVGEDRPAVADTERIEEEAGEEQVAILTDLPESEGLEGVPADAPRTEEDIGEERAAVLAEAPGSEGLKEEEQEEVFEGAADSTTEEDGAEIGSGAVEGLVESVSEEPAARPAGFCSSDQPEDASAAAVAAAAEGTETSGEPLASAEEVLEAADCPASEPEEPVQSTVPEDESEAVVAKPTEDVVKPEEGTGGVEADASEGWPDDAVEAMAAPTKDVDLKDDASGDGSNDAVVSSLPVVAEVSSSTPAPSTPSSPGSVVPSSDDRAEKHEGEEADDKQEPVEGMASSSSPTNRPSRSQLPDTTLNLYDKSNAETGHDGEQREGRREGGPLLLDVPPSPLSSPAGEGGVGGPASSLPVEAPPSSSSPPKRGSGFAAPLPSRTPSPRSPRSPSSNRVGFEATSSARSPSQSPTRHHRRSPIELSESRDLLETSSGPMWSPARSPRRRSVADIGQTPTPEKLRGDGSKRTPRGGTPRGGARERERRASRRDSTSSRGSLRRTSSSSVVSRPWGLSSQERLSDGEDGGGGGGGGDGRRGSSGSLLSVGSNNAADDDSVPATGGAVPGGKPKLRRVESLNNLQKEGEEYGGLSNSRGRSFTAVNDDTDALGLDLAAVVTHLKEVCTVSFRCCVLQMVHDFVSTNRQARRTSFRHLN